MDTGIALAEPALASSAVLERHLFETRELWWNIDHNIGKVIFYSMAAVSVAIFLYGFIAKVIRISKGKSLKNDMRMANPLQRVFNLLTFGLGQAKIAQKKFPGLAHAMVLVGFLTLWVVTDIVAIQENAGLDVYFFQGTFYKVVSFAADMGGLLLFIGVCLFVLRRYALKPDALDNTQMDWIQPAFLLLFVISGFLLEGFRMAATGQIESYAPVGAAFARFFEFMTPEDMQAKHAIIWWFHSVLTFLFIALIPFTKFQHILLSPLSIFFRSERPRGALYTPYNLMDLMAAEENPEAEEVNEEDFITGVMEYSDFSWKSLLDSEACTACGRCHVMCPAQNTDKPLSPKHLMLDIKKLTEKSEVYAEITEDVLWSCTSCNACVEECPVLIEHVDTIVDMRRGLLANNQAPDNLKATLKNIRTKSNPWGMDPNDREKWLDELQVESSIEVKRARDHVENFEYLYWVGSPGAYDSRSIEVSKANARLFTKAGIDFAVLGKEEKSSGDTARRAGDEGLFQELAIENIEILKAYGVKKIITQCPHVYNTFKNEYPEFGLEGVEVIHHTELLADLIEEGKIVPEKEVSETITYHDPCYLGRYNRVFDPPRFILEKIPGLELKHIEHEKTKSTCCGGGGAQIWYETPGAQINVMRYEELNEHSPNKISVACPYCSIMLSTASSTAFPDANVPEVEDVAITLAKSVF